MKHLIINNDKQIRIMKKKNNFIEKLSLFKFNVDFCVLLKFIESYCFIFFLFFSILFFFLIYFFLIKKYS